MIAQKNRERRYGAFKRILERPYGRKIDSVLEGSFDVRTIELLGKNEIQMAWFKKRKGILKRGQLTEYLDHFGM